MRNAILWTGLVVLAVGTDAQAQTFIPRPGSVSAVLPGAYYGPRFAVAAAGGQAVSVTVVGPNVDIEVYDTTRFRRLVATGRSTGGSATAGWVSAGGQFIVWVRNRNTGQLTVTAVAR